jgi:integrase
VSRTFRSLYNFARAKYKDGAGRRLLGDNPVYCLNERKLWYRQKRRRTFLDDDQLPKWIQHIEQMPNRVAGDLYLLLLLTGLRREEATTMKWEDVDMERGYFSIPDTTAKNGDPHVMPMTPRVRQIFESRLKNRVNGYVFPGADGHVVNVRRVRDQIVKLSGIKFTPHDLRRTFITAAESLELNRYLLKKLLNHRTEDDVTSGYIMWRPKRLLKPLCRIEKLILEGPDDEED